MRFDLVTLGLVGAVAAAGRLSKGSFNDEDEPVTALARPRERHLPEARRRAELALPDQQLARLMLGGGDVLAGMTFREATLNDPRRIDALISQRIGRAFEQVFGAPPGYEAEQLHLEGVRFARQAHEGQLPVSAMVSMVEENLDRALFATFPRMPHAAKAELRRNLPVFDQALDEAADLARQAAREARNTEDNPEWLALADYLEGHKAQMRRALAEGLPGPVGGRRELEGPGRMRGLPGPRGGRNRGSAYTCPACRDEVCSIHGGTETLRRGERAGSSNVHGSAAKAEDVARAWAQGRKASGGSALETDGYTLTSYGVIIGSTVSRRRLGGVEETLKVAFTKPSRSSMTTKRHITYATRYADEVMESPSEASRTSLTSRSTVVKKPVEPDTTPWGDYEMGPWRVDMGDTSGDWYIIQQETGKRVKIGPVGGRRSNNYDKAIKEAAKRNRALADKRLLG